MGCKESDMTERLSLPLSEGIHLNIINTIYNIKPSGEKLKVFSLKTGTKQECFLSPLLFNLVIKVLLELLEWEKENPNRKERSKIVFVCRLCYLIYRRP